MMFGDDIHGTFFEQSHDAYNDKSHRRGRSRSRISTSDDISTSFTAPLKSGSPWIPAPPRSCRKTGKYLVVLVVTVAFIFFWNSLLGISMGHVSYLKIREYGFPLGFLPESRTRELKDTLVGYKHRGGDCNVSSLDLHIPFGSICPDRNSMLTAMSSGGRVGKDSPYVPRGCDMRWFSTLEACEILGRYSQVILVGDSMLRHVIGALNILIREDLGYGGVTDWNFDAEEKRKCFCNNQFDVHDCSVQGIFSTADVIEHDPLSLMCPKLIPEWNTDLRIEQMVRYPIPDEERRRFERAIDPNPSQLKAFVLGHGLWNNLDVDQAVNWLDLVLDTIESKTGARMRLRGRSPRKNLPILLMTPNAAGEKKPDEWIVSQGNKALVRFEHAMAVHAAKKRVDHLGTWNMSIQATLYDGVHMDMRGNLLKAMMVLNWLNLLDARG
ncbi:uncharacterized protein GGS22DRAFT_194942 [Annulohypoxylon maeteangense]|uniref:uncharacterized protein n=1 Tax=Annulohypoxylon maeteangense TaxID=1927788 RepID=UPI00200827BF|nr:uncharacterized protein GGS22DRAFT_194942 [Annulohypoxylon maeteangense]KAI0883683.1 hypothetical protein GGS22DRAFT_194942 [Annulohypoxylon maeteangense]